MYNQRGPHEVHEVYFRGKYSTSVTSVPVFKSSGLEEAFCNVGSGSVGIPGYLYIFVGYTEYTPSLGGKNFLLSSKTDTLTSQL
jgi:hypothetical protein